MNMNDSDWNEFWDDEAEDDRDDDEQNDLGSDVDANNDETFDNAAEWNEDEHEELIARDSILSQTVRSNNHARDNSRNVNGRSRGRSNEVLANNSLNDSSSNENRREEFAFLATTGAWNNVADLVNQSPNYNHLQNQNHFNPQNNSSQWQRPLDASPSMRPHHIHLHQSPRDLIMRPRDPSPPPLIHNLSEKPHTLIGENSILTPNAAPQGPKVIRVDDLERQLMKTSIGGQNVPNRIHASEAATIPIQRCDQPKRSSWSPFGGKDLFTSADSQQQQQARAQMNSQQQQNLMSQNLMSRQLSLEQQQRILLQQHQIAQQQQQLQQMALLKQQQELLQQQQLMAQQHQLKKQQQQPSRLLPQNAQCFTVEELERQMIADRSNNSKEPKATVMTSTTSKPNTEKQANHHHHQQQHEQQIQQNQRSSKGQESRQNTNRQVAHNNSHDRRNGEKYQERSDQKQHQERTHRDRKDRRDHRDDRENRHYDSRKKLTIIPPQVQLSVIEKEKRLHSLTTMHQDEFLQDIMPTSRTGFLFNRHSNVSSEKANHDGVLTEKERSWLTRIQEKIQADYDDNVDQDYYYLLYFNRSSMTEGATNQKPSGPGVLDRRFIPRERLLYNTSD